MRAIEKKFGGVRALSGVDFTLCAGSVHALVGENGAGKSTLIKVTTGAYAPSAGTITLAGEPVVFRSPQHAQERGVVAVHQEVMLLMHRTVAENVFLGREPSRFGVIDRRAMNDRTRALLEELGLDIDPRATLGDLPIASRQMVAIARGASLGPKVLVLDEPTSSLPEPSVALLYDVIGRLRDRGTGIVFISHRFDEIEAVCDTVTILRDGKRVSTGPLAGLSRLELVCLMLGRRPDEVREHETSFARRAAPAPDDAPPALRVRGLRRGRALAGVSFDVRRGEVVGLAGLLGSGRSETALALFGAEPPEDGSVRVEGERVDPRSPREAIDAGLALLPEDRARDGIVPELSVRENLTLAVLPRLSRGGFVSRGREREIVDSFMRRLRIKASSAEQKIRELSGGNQQKVLLARWLCLSPRVLVLDEPTRGVDVGAKAEIQALIGEMSETGLSVLMISSELEELVEGCSRIVVLRDGRSVAELEADEVDAGAIVRAMAQEGSP
jgi:ribose transport system ATP-binding protein